jgi:hypothetical protein
MLAVSRLTAYRFIDKPTDRLADSFGLESKSELSRVLFTCWLVQNFAKAVSSTRVRMNSRRSNKTDVWDVHGTVVVQVSK